MRHSLLALVFTAAVTFAADGDYALGPDSQVQGGVPQGELKAGVFTESKVFPGTVHDYSVYVPKQYDAAKPAALMVFFDGGGYAKADGGVRATVVMDNLIAKKDMPVTIGVFVNPGTVKATEAGAKDRSNRSFEYDSLGDANAKFIIEELLPVATKGLNISADPASRAACGMSSGGIAAFTLAWERPESFGKVVSWIGSFTNIRGGYVYPAQIRQTKGKPKAIRVFLQDGSNDLDNLHGNWPLSNQDMAAVLKFAGYDYQFELGTGSHSPKQGASLFPTTLRWLWRDAAK